MNAETLLGAILIATWAAIVLRGLERTAVSARKGRKWERAYLVGLGVGCAFGVGVVLSIKTPFGFGSGPSVEGGQRGRGKRPYDQNGTSSIPRMTGLCARRSKMPSCLPAHKLRERPRPL